MLYEEFKKLTYRDQQNFINSIDVSTSDGRKNINDIINSYPDFIVTELIKNVPALTEEDLIIIYQRFSTEGKGTYIANTFVTHPNFSLSVLKYIISDKNCRLKNSIFVSAAKFTENEDIYNILFSLGKKSILNACKKNHHFIFDEHEALPEEVKMILFLLECGNISEDTGIEMIDKFNLHKSIIKAMLKMNTKWREHILSTHKLDFGNADEQLAIAKNNKTDKETLYELSLVAKNDEVRKAILVHHNCTLYMARNMFN